MQCGTVLAALNYGAWVALSVNIAGLITGQMAANGLRQQLFAMNKSMSALQSRITWWDAQPLVVRRSANTKKYMVEATEDAFLKLIEGFVVSATAAKGDDDGPEEDDEEGSGNGGAQGDKAKNS